MDFFLVRKSRFTIPEAADFWVPEVIDGTSLQTVLRVYFVIFWQMSVYGWERWDAGQTDRRRTTSGKKFEPPHTLWVDIHLSPDPQNYTISAKSEPLFDRT